MPTVSIVSENGRKNAPLTDPPIRGSIAAKDPGRSLRTTEPWMTLAAPGRLRRTTLPKVTSLSWMG
jgi:hypothetical protein